MNIYRVVYLIAIILIPSYSFSAVIFSENYDSISSSWNCSDSLPSGWTAAANCPGSSSYGGITHYAGEITTGGRSGNSLKLWRRNGIWVDYHGYLNKVLTADEFANGYKELYIRWYVKIDPNWDANISAAETHKLNRAYFGSSAGSTSGEWYIDVKGNSFKTGKLSLYNTSGGGVWYSQSTVSNLGINDGKWHSLEWRLKLNSTTGASDGGFQIFVDGEAISICDGMGQNCSTNQIMNLGVATDEYFTSLFPPAIGNLTNGSWDFPTDGWYAIEFDDYAVSTTYIGPDSETVYLPISSGGSIFTLPNGSILTAPAQ